MGSDKTQNLGLPVESGVLKEVIFFKCISMCHGKAELTKELILQSLNSL